MIIQSDKMNMGAQRTYHSARYEYSRQTAWNDFGNTILSMELQNTESENVMERSGDWKKEEEKQEKGNGGMGKESMKNLMEQMNQTSGIRRSSLGDTIRTFQQIRQKTLEYLLYMLFGRKHPEMISPGESPADTGIMEGGGAGGESYSCFYYSEDETTCFETTGTVVTADGKEHSFAISLEMSRSFTEMAETQVDFGRPRLCDPLVINLNVPTANVTDQKFYFDIDQDGEKESISELGAGSGYLALDQNDDGVINDGSELFGTQSGNGFSDLMSYDGDGNHWIDEADEIFSKLKIWTRDSRGQEVLLSLKEAGVGAIYLGYENTEFSLNQSTDNQTNAIIQKTGIFLYENGGVGTMQQVDLAT